MKKYKVKAIHLSENEISHLQAIGVDEGSIIQLDDSQKEGHLCFITLDHSTFCLRNEIMKSIELEEI